MCIRDRYSFKLNQSISSDDARDFNDPFRTSTEDPFRNQQNVISRDQDFIQQQQAVNTFQNNEQGSNSPFNPFDPTRSRDSFDNPTRSRPSFDSPYNRGPDVDEFGDPLDEIHSTDTTRFELGTGGDVDARKCPYHWWTFRESCYKFTRSPDLRRDTASENCREYRHQDTDRADLASVSSLEEHRFIQKVLNEIDKISNFQESELI